MDPVPLSRLRVILGRCLAVALYSASSLLFGFPFDLLSPGSGVDGVGNRRQESRGHSFSPRFLSSLWPHSLPVLTNLMQFRKPKNSKLHGTLKLDLAC